MARRSDKQGSDNRQERLAAALRANLAKRKALARARGKGAAGEGAEHTASGAAGASHGRPDTDEGQDGEAR